MQANLENSAMATGLEKVSFHSNPKEGQCQTMFKLPHIALISHASKVTLKILQARLHQYENFQMYKLGLEKAEEQRSNCQHLLDHRESKGIPEKHILHMFH